MSILDLVSAGVVKCRTFLDTLLGEQKFCPLRITAKSIIRIKKLASLRFEAVNYSGKLLQPAPAPNYSSKLQLQANPTGPGSKLLQPASDPIYSNLLRSKLLQPSPGSKLLPSATARSYSNWLRSQTTLTGFNYKLLQPAPSYSTRLRIKATSTGSYSKLLQPASDLSNCSGSKALRLTHTPSMTVISLFSWWPVER